MAVSNDLFQLSPLPMWVFHTDTLTFLAVNDAVTKAYGYTAEDLLSAKLFTLYAPEDIRDFKDSPSAPAAADLFSNGHFKQVKKNGEAIWVNLESSLIEFEGAPARLVVASAITAQMKMNTERYDMISKATSDTVRDWNLLNDQVVWNKGIRGIFGHKQLVDNTSDSAWWALQIHPEDRDRVTGNMQRHIREKVARWQEEYRFRCADGSYKHVLDRGFMVFNEAGHSVRMLGSMQDISRRKNEEQWSRLLESVVVHATDAVLICTGKTADLEQVIIYVNEAYIKLSGYSRAELIGTSPEISRGPDTDRQELDKLNRAIAEKMPCKIEVVNYTRMGEAYWVSESHAPVTDARGEVTHWITIQRDITEYKKHQTKIEEQNKRFREIQWIQSHLVRAPLARVMGLVDLLSNFENGDNREELLAHLKNSARELDAIIIDIADKKPED